MSRSHVLSYCESSSSPSRTGASLRGQRQSGLRLAGLLLALGPFSASGQPHRLTARPTLSKLGNDLVGVVGRQQQQPRRWGPRRTAATELPMDSLESPERKEDSLFGIAKT